jgi:transposase, IS30 family
LAAAMIEAMGELPEHLRRSITWERGSEIAKWCDIQLQLGAPVYFCNPHSLATRQQRKHHRLLRFWFEKGTDLSGHTRPTSSASKTPLTAAPGQP